MESFVGYWVAATFSLQFDTNYDIAASFVQAVDDSSTHATYYPDATIKETNVVSSFSV